MLRKEKWEKLLLLFLRAWELLSDYNNGSHKLLHHCIWRWDSELTPWRNTGYVIWMADAAKERAQSLRKENYGWNWISVLFLGFNSSVLQAKQALHLQCASLLKAFAPATWRMVQQKKFKSLFSGFFFSFAVPKKEPHSYALDSER